MRAYSAKPACSANASKLPMQPLSLELRPGRDERVFQVTNKGLASLSVSDRGMPAMIDVLLIIWELRRNKCVLREFAE